MNEDLERDIRDALKAIADDDKFNELKYLVSEAARMLLEEVTGYPEPGSIFPWCKRAKKALGIS